MNREERDAWRERLAASRIELLEDIAQREIADLEQPPPRRAPEMVFKTARQNGDDTNGITAEPLPIDPDLLDGIAQALAEQRQELAAMIDQAIAPLRERIAVLEGQLSTLVTLIGGSNGNARSKRAPRLIEPPK